MYAHHTAAPAPPHSLPHMGINNQHSPPPPPPPHSYATHNTYAHNGGAQYAPAPATVGYAPSPPMHSYTVNSHPHYPPPPPVLPRSAPPVDYGSGSGTAAFNDFGMPSHDVHSGVAHPVHPSTVGGFPARAPPPRVGPGYQSFQGFQGCPSQSLQSPQPTPTLRGVEAIPSPVPRASYAGPQFKTFAERKREREEELRRQAAEAAAKQQPPPPPTPAARAPATPAPPARSVSPVPNGPARPDSVVPPGARSPSPAALRMMGAQSPNGQPIANGRPTPPPRSMSGPAPPSPGGRALPTPRGASGPSPSPSPQPWAQAGQAIPPVPPIPQQFGGSISPQPPQPPPRSGSVSPAAPQMRSPSPVPPPRSSTSPIPPSPSHSNVPPASPMRSVVNLPPSVPRNAAVQALLERSDTVSSVRSLDRGGFGPNRVLPQPPVGVKSSMSLDRGSSPAGRMAPMPRRGPSPVPEEGAAEIVGRMAGVHIGGVPPRSESASPTKRDNPLPRSQSPHPSVAPKRASAPTISIDSVGALPKPPAINVAPPVAPPPRQSPTKAAPPPPPPLVIEPPAPPMIMVRSDSPPTPKITVGTPPTPTIAVSPPAICVEPPRPSSPGFTVSGLPTIDVQSSDTADEPPAISISVPSINVGGNGAPSTPTRSSRVNARSPRSPRGVATRIEPEGAILCAGCDNPIIGRIVSAMKQRWHPQCFTCGVCGDLLEHVSSYEHEGKPYCHLDYHDRFAHKCHHCHTPIVDARFITLNDEVLGERYYHELHFFCSECGDPFLDPSKSSAAGTEFGGANREEENETNAFVIHKGHPYCERCHLRLHKPKCRACKNPIPDVAVSAMGAKYHQECFVCANCSCAFANQLFFPRDGKAFCTECFEQMTDM